MPSIMTLVSVVDGKKTSIILHIQFYNDKKNDIMRKCYFIYLLFSCLIYTSCEKTAFEKEIPATQGITRSTPEEVNYYGSNFQDIIYNIDEAFGFIQVNPIGAEYSFGLATIVDTPNKKSVVSVVGGTIIYNGHDVGNQISGTSGMIRFTVKFTSTMAKITLSLKGTNPNDKRNSARLAIDERKYNGKSLPLPNGDPLHSDLILGQLP